MRIDVFNLKKKKVSVEELTKKQLNLHPFKNGKLSLKQKRLRYAAMGAAFVCVALGFYTIFLYFQNETLNREIALRMANLQVEQERLSNQQVLDAINSRIDYKSDLLKYIDKSNTSAVLVLEVIERNVPEAVYYVNLDFLSSEAIRISCRTEDQSWIAMLIHQLKLENYFDDVFVESINVIPTSVTGRSSESYEFQLICTFGGLTDETQK